MNFLALSNLKRFSSLIKTASFSSKQQRQLIQQYVSCTVNGSTAATYSPNCYYRNAEFQLHFSKGHPTQLRRYSHIASDVQRKNDMVKKKVKSLLEEQQSTSGTKMKIGNLPLAERNKASSLIPQYLAGVAADPEVQHEVILEIFRIYAVTNRPLAQDKVDFPEEFEHLILATEHALSAMNLSELEAMSCYLDEIQSQRLSSVQKLIRSLCQECSARLYQKPSFMEAMSLYDLALTMYPKALPKNYHEIFNEYFLNNFDSASLKERIKLMYFYSLNPRPLFASLFQELLKSVTPHVASMPLKMQGIVAFSVTKSGIQLEPNLPLLQELVPSLVNFLLSNAKFDELEEFSVQSEIELMRLARYHDEDVTFALESFLVSCNENYLTMENMPCFLAFLATRDYNRIVFEKMEACLIKILANETRESLQLPDLARILWAMSSASHKCSSLFIEEMKKELHSQLAVNLLNKNLLKFVDIIVSLAMMGHIDLELCRHALKPPKGRAVNYGGRLEVKLGSRIVALRECLSIERPDVIFPIPSNRSVASAAPEPAALLQTRPLLGKLHSALRAALAQRPDVVLSFGCPLETVKLAGVCLQIKDQIASAQIKDESVSKEKSTPSVENEHESHDGLSHNRCSESDITRLVQCLTQPVSLEVLDETNTIAEGKDGRRHNGMFNYKLRLMQKIGWRCVLLTKEEIDASNDAISLIVSKIQHSYPEL